MEVLAKYSANAAVVQEHGNVSALQLRGEPCANSVSILFPFFKRLFRRTEPTACPEIEVPTRFNTDSPTPAVSSAWDNVAMLAEGSLPARVALLQRLVLDLLREVEALRRTQLEVSRAEGIFPKESCYGRAYRATALMTHDATGLSSGLHKLLLHWEERLGNRWTGPLNEIVMLERLGYSAQEIERYIKEAEEYESRT